MQFHAAALPGERRVLVRRGGRVRLATSLDILISQVLEPLKHFTVDLRGRLTCGGVGPHDEFCGQVLVLMEATWQDRDLRATS